ncbi:MAG: tRNA 2-selenouridine(34) synthase MnmH [Parvularculaceae bacterium]
MIEQATDVAPETLSLYDAIIDVRSPGEFEEDRIPGAINLPVLSNEERAEVGTIYVQESRFKARRIGAAHVARNVARHIETALADKPAKFRPLLYCWRGGMRSGSMATILSQIGWRVGVLKGGYKTWRRDVVEGLRGEDRPLNIILLDGQTGTAKSEILAQLSLLGVQTIDLETHAAHRGSVFGGFADRPQPTQKYFESLIWRELCELDPAQPIVIEAESLRIGAREAPPVLWRQMLAAPRITVTAAPRERARYLVRAYHDVVSNKAEIERAITSLAPFHRKTQVEEWRAMAATDEFEALAESLMHLHYDPLYDRGRKRANAAPLPSLALDRLDEEAIASAAKEIAEIVRSRFC